MNSQPSTHGSNGKGPDGKFLPGNKLGQGNPLAGRAAKLRATALASVSQTDMRRIMKAMVKAAIGGDVAAAKVCLSYSIGEPLPFDLIERVQTLEAAQRGRR